MRLRFLNFSPGVSIFLIVVFTLSVSILASIAIAAALSRPALSGEVLKYFDKDFILRAFDYNRTSLFVSIASRVIQWAYFALIVFLVWKFFSNTATKSLVVAGYIALFFVLMYILLLPLSYYRGFVMEHAWGLSTQSLSSWFIDHLKSVLINIAINTVVLTLLHILFKYTPRYWYIIAFALFVVFLVVMIIVYPLIIDPLFYDFKPLEDRSLKKRIEEVTEKAGIEVDTILVADASRRTRRANAYFTGLGFSKRIVLYDNLLERFSEDEVTNVVAHEAAHWQRLHIFKSLLIGVASGALLIFVLRLIVNGYGGGNSLLLILVIFIFFNLVMFLAQPLENALSRRFEKEADMLTVKFTDDPDTQVMLFKNLALSNLSNVKPNEYIKYMLYSHPPILERIKKASSLKD